MHSWPKRDAANDDAADATDHAAGGEECLYVSATGLKLDAVLSTTAATFEFALSSFQIDNQLHYATLPQLEVVTWGCAAPWDGIYEACPGRGGVEWRMQQGGWAHAIRRGLQ